MKRNYNGGFTLIEVLVAIVLLALIVIPISSGMILSHRMNAKTEALVQAEMHVSSAVEYLMANGYSNDTATAAEDNYGVAVGVSGEVNASWCRITVVDKENTDVFVVTSVRVSPEGGGT